jgi:hypothetical protein
MSYPDVYLFSVENENCVRIIAIVAMSEEEALEEVQSEYSTCNPVLLENISIQQTGTMKEIYRFDW